ncbi:hypothetical protein BV25DRAFT_1826496 [Artomyces pyxidatus]|uniref:Uncharacterized protein n=1 Tax=Artomyces pyxidatus TaxID=48021 RepID=A0ACB8T174_9AGAM|nr:hypothetical protein BV25DRAFT_1826496 [Artomyces pyxidatus]
MSMSKRRRTIAVDETDGERDEPSAHVLAASAVSAVDLDRKGKEREGEVVLPEETPAGPSTSVFAQEDPPVDAQPVPEPATSDEEVIRPFSVSDTTPDPPPVANTINSRVGPRPAGQQFPPAGTLVVVQGVVHTSDVAPATSASEPPPRRASTVPAGTEHRLSSMLTRPVRSRRSSYVSPDTSSASDTQTGEESARADSSATSEEAPAAEHRPTEQPRTSVLSPTSIDVLGTLLSVATAATAASLVTGSSDPLFSSGLALPGGNQTPASPETGRPMSPTPTAGLSGTGGLGIPPLPPSSRDRMRNAWGSIRDRFGLSSGRHPPALTSPSPTPPATPPAVTEPQDPRTQLLTEMARAFHLGMGLDNSDGAAGAPGSPLPTGPQTVQLNISQPASDPDRPLPPEDSFERFLLDLQTDLRRTLSEERSDSPATAEPSSPILGLDDPMPLATYPDDLPPFSLDAEPELDDSDLPPLADGSDSDIDEPEHVDEESDDEFDEPAMEEAQLGWPPGSTEPPHIALMGPRTSSGSERRPGGGLNWWRMYRFPPMTVPPTQSQPSASLPSVHASLSSAAASLPQAPLSPAPQPPSSDPSSNTSDPAATASQSNIIVPVIVVGLQSVNANNANTANTARRGASENDDQAPEEDTSATTNTAPTDDIEDDDELELNELDTENMPADGQGNTATGRPWHTRAADRLRGLRPGRRADATPRPAEGNGSTTFFIYVIGGYYPPDHHLVTGSDPLDSFEALWELADLLGQVKPPTATKEDIDKSGLEIIRQANLEQYEKDGRVAPMCVDRCLICLEDYAEEEDLRLLSCRHAFHKDCVDKWLETGRNNCPACRSQGVATESSAPTGVPSSA